MYRLLGIALLAASGTLSVAAHAQTLAPTRIGVVGGVNFATVGGDDTDTAKNRVGLLTGVSVLKPLAGNVSVEVNGLFSQKGAKQSGEGASATLALDYFEAPILLRYTAGSDGGVRPHLSGGVSLGYQVACKVSASADGFSAESDCDNAAGESDGSVKKFDAGLVVGGGLDFPLANNRTMTLGARYSFGLTDIAEGSNVRNRVIQLYAGFAMPLR